MNKPQPPKDLWAQMDELVGDKMNDNDEGFTYAEFMDRYHVKRTAAKDRINKLLREGKLISGRRRVNGQLLKVFRPA